MDHGGHLFISMERALNSSLLNSFFFFFPKWALKSDLAGAWCCHSPCGYTELKGASLCDVRGERP